MESPIFIVGNSRSGTTLLYHMILSSGGFAVYRAETHVYNILPPFFGHLERKDDRDKLVQFWADSALFKRSGLDASRWMDEAYGRVFTYGDLLNCFMSSIAQDQGVDRWAECTPAHLLHMKKIKHDLPKARFIHIIRDGRDVAISLEKLKWRSSVRIFSLDLLDAATLTWEWNLAKGREIGRQIGEDYLEVRFEDLVCDPQDTLKGLGRFICHPLEYDLILSNAIGSVKKPNTAFKGGQFSPVERWRALNTDKNNMLESYIGSTLEDIGYPLISNKQTGASFIKTQLLKKVFKMYLGAMFFIKNNTIAGRFCGETPLRFDERMSQIFGG